MAAIPASSGGPFRHTGSRRVFDRQTPSFVDIWFIVSTVCTIGCVGPRVPPLICPLSEVLRSRLRVDPIVLCDLAERLCGLFIMARGVNSEGVLHNVTLPRSWFINLILPSMNLRKDTSTFFTFAETMIDLMQQIDAQVQRSLTSPSNTREQFVADGGPITDFTGALCVARM